MYSNRQNYLHFSLPCFIQVVLQVVSELARLELFTYVGGYDSRDSCDAKKLHHKGRDEVIFYTDALLPLSRAPYIVINFVL